MARLAPITKPFVSESLSHNAHIIVNNDNVNISNLSSVYNISICGEYHSYPFPSYAQAFIIVDALHLMYFVSFSLAFSAVCFGKAIYYGVVSSVVYNTYANLFE